MSAVQPALFPVDHLYVAPAAMAEEPDVEAELLAVIPGQLELFAVEAAS